MALVCSCSDKKSSGSDYPETPREYAEAMADLVRKYEQATKDGDEYRIKELQKEGETLSAEIEDLCKDEEFQKALTKPSRDNSRFQLGLSKHLSLHKTPEDYVNKQVELTEQYMQDLKDGDEARIKELKEEADALQKEIDEKCKDEEFKKAYDELAAKAVAEMAANAAE